MAYVCVQQYRQVHVTSRVGVVVDPGPAYGGVGISGVGTVDGAVGGGVPVVATIFPASILGPFSVGARST